jgi:hypothetical protein
VWPPPPKVAEFCSVMVGGCVQDNLESIYRRGHSVHVYPEESVNFSKGDLILFGGFGFDGRCKQGQSSLHKRSGDVMVHSAQRGGGWKLVDAVAKQAPAPREFHGSCMIQIDGAWYLFVLGGRASPKQGIADAYLFDFHNLEWLEVPLDPVICCRWRHTCTAIDGTNQIFICGGLAEVSEGVEGAASSKKFCKDAWLVELSIEARQVRVVRADQVLSESDILSRHSHTADFLNGKMYLYGGMLTGNLTDNPRDAQLYVLSAESSFRSVEVVSDNLPPSRYSHSSVVWNGKVVYVGGITGDSAFNQLVLFDPETRRFEEIEMTQCNSCGGAETSSPLYLKHRSVSIDNGKSIVIVGGGALCFSFGTRFSPSCTLSHNESSGVWKCCFHKLSAEKINDGDQKEHPVIRDSSLENVGTLKKSVADGTPLSPEQVILLSDAEKKLVCQGCQRLFQSRNQLFKHIKLMGHRQT